ncbi:MAG: zinc-ribbon domain-containing protein [Planctomycetota bacterium]
MPRPAADTFECPNCGEDVPASAAACPACGSDEETGWSEDTDYDGLDLPNWNDEPSGFEAKPCSPAWFALTAAALIAVIVLVWVIGG